MIRTVCAVAVFVLASSPSARALDCPLSKGVYTPIDADDDWSAEDGVVNAWEITHPGRAVGDSDRPWVVRLAERRRGLAAEFGVAHPPGFGQAHVFMIAPPAGVEKRFDATRAPSSPLYYFAEDLKRVDPDGEGEAKAPPYVQLPGLSKAFWVWKRDGRRFVPPDGLWKLTDCRR